MLSILIPIYNIDVLPLVYLLYHGAKAQQIDFEIICIDDCSPKKDFLQALKHSDLLQKENIHLIELAENIGRAKIRNKLAHKAQYEHLWFMDADMMPIGKSATERLKSAKILLANYIDTIQAQIKKPFVIYGGQTFGKEKPYDFSLHLHWFSGNERESKLAAQRNAQPYANFITTNFICHRDVFKYTNFDEHLKQYGHEDTIFGRDLKLHNIPIIHIDNAMENTGLGNAKWFIEKNKLAIQNLYEISTYSDLSQSNIRLWDTYQKLKKYKLTFPMRCFHVLAHQYIENYISSREFPNLKVFDIYKLGYLCQVAHEKK